MAATWNETAYEQVTPKPSTTTAHSFARTAFIASPFSRSNPSYCLVKQKIAINFFLEELRAMVK